MTPPKATALNCVVINEWYDWPIRIPPWWMADRNEFGVYLPLSKAIETSAFFMVEPGRNESTGNDGLRMASYVQTFFVGHRSVYKTSQLVAPNFTGFNIHPESRLLNVRYWQHPQLRQFTVHNILQTRINTGVIFSGFHFFNHFRSWNDYLYHEPLAVRHHDPIKQYSAGYQPLNSDPFTYCIKPINLHSAVAAIVNASFSRYKHLEVMLQSVPLAEVEFLCNTK